MKKSRICILGIIAAMLLSGCENKKEPAEEQSGNMTVSETTSAASSETKKTAAKKKEVKPLSPSSRQAYFQNEEFSVAAGLTALRSSLYYPDIVHDLGANPDLFVVTLEVKAKNMTEENKTFDASKFTIPDMFSYGDDVGNFKDIKPGRSEIGELRFLCSLEQAAAIDGILYGGEYLEAGEDFYPEEFDEIIDVQSADDVSEYLYRQHVHHMYSGHYTIKGQPTIYEMNNIKGIKKDGKNYLSVTYTGYNRSDYAQIIDPSGFTFLCSEYKNKDKNSVSSDTALEPIEPIYISTDENLMYAPTEADIVLDKVGKIYELPEYICMNPENPTVFTIIYDLKNYDRIRRFVYKDSYENEPYYSSVDSPQKNWDVWETIKDWDIWEEKELES